MIALIGISQKLSKIVKVLVLFVIHFKDTSD